MLASSESNNVTASWRHAILTSQMYSILYSCAFVGYGLVCAPRRHDNAWLHDFRYIGRSVFISAERHARSLAQPDRKWTHTHTWIEFKFSFSPAAVERAQANELNVCVCVPDQKCVRMNLVYISPGVRYNSSLMRWMSCVCLAGYEPAFGMYSELVKFSWSWRKSENTMATPSDRKHGDRERISGPVK